MIKAKKILKRKKDKMLKTSNYPKISGIIYKFKGALEETLYASYDSNCDCLRYVGDKLFDSLKKIKNKEELYDELKNYKSLHDNDYGKMMKPVYLTEDYTKENIRKLKKYAF